MAANVLGMAFMPYYRHIMSILETDKELKKTAKGIFHQVAYAAVGAAAGGVVAGPAGAMVGGIAGSVYGYMTVDPYDSMVEVIRNLTDEEKENLVNKVKELVGSSSIEALVSFVGQQVNREVFVNLVRQFTENSKGG